jgi:hypothetical protein
VSNPTTGVTEITNFLGWISMSGSSPSELTRNGTKVPGSDGKLGSNSYQDKDDQATNDLNPGVRYNYALNFGESVATQSIVPALLPDTRLTSVSPSGSDTVTAGSEPTLTWSKVGATPKGYIVTVADMGTGSFSGSSLSGGTPVYLAFLDAASHSTSVKYGTLSDLAAITGDQLLREALAENPFFKPVNKALEAGKTYAWTVVALDHDGAKTAFAIGKPNSLGIFTVQP